MNKGFTIIEVVVTLGILAIIFGATAPINWEFYQKIELRTEYNNYLSYLKLARAASLANKNASAHGVYVGLNNVTVFEGNSYALRNQSQDQIFSLSSLVTVTGATEIIFNPLSANTTNSTITLSNSLGVYNIDINTQGKIE